MDNIHAWLYDRYCEPILCHMWNAPAGYGLQRAAEEALKASGKFIPWQVVTLSAGGEVLER